MSDKTVSLRAWNRDPYAVRSDDGQDLNSATRDVLASFSRRFEFDRARVHVRETPQREVYLAAVAEDAMGEPRLIAAYGFGASALCPQASRDAMFEVRGPGGAPLDESVVSELAMHPQELVELTGREARQQGVLNLDDPLGFVAEVVSQSEWRRNANQLRAFVSHIAEDLQELRPGAELDQSGDRGETLVNDGKRRLLSIALGEQSHEVVVAALRQSDLTVLSHERLDLGQVRFVDALRCAVGRVDTRAALVELHGSIKDLAHEQGTAHLALSAVGSMSTAYGAKLLVGADQRAAHVLRLAEDALGDALVKQVSACTLVPKSGDPTQLREVVAFAVPISSVRDERLQAYHAVDRLAHTLSRSTGLQVAVSLNGRTLADQQERLWSAGRAHEMAAGR